MKTRKPATIILIAISLIFLFSTATCFAVDKPGTEIIKKADYIYTIETPKATDGKGEIVFTIKAKDGHKVNPDFPFKLKAKTADGVTLLKSKLNKKDAVKIDSKTLIMKLEYKADTKIATAKIDIKFRFGLCTIKNGEVFSCEFYTEKQTVTLP